MPTSRPPAILLGGDTNALAIARSLGAAGITVYTIGVAPYVERSRWVSPLPVTGRAARPEDVWAQWLLGPNAQHLHGSVVLATGDIGILAIARNRPALLERYLLDVSDVDAQLAMLDKLTTYETARAAGVPTPLFWRVDCPADLQRLRAELVYPLIIKPLLSHEYKARFPGLSKFRLATGWDELQRGHRDLDDAGLAVMLVEKIPGGDELLCSYTTYIDGSGSPTFDYTKRMLRRNLPNEGLGCYHVTDWIPEVKEVALQLLKHAGLRGPAAVEFVRDTRDGKLKLIECNARFSAALPLTVASGIDLPLHVYLRTLGERHELPRSYRPGKRLLYPSDDVRSFLALRRAGSLDTGAWVRSLLHRQTFPVWSSRDPLPALARGWQRSVSGAQKAVAAR
ncbi:MAG: ATP-grasp domain-containing protein, partial [Pseudonocardia sp.]|nr:ATP-grasp domain-containing protein [Pseudonocardia sp.]